MARDCGDCAHWKELRYKVTHGQRNVSGGLIWYTIWSDNQCKFKNQRGENHRCEQFEGNRRFKESETRFKKWREEFDRQIEEYDKSVGVLSGKE